jgi:hypothetical protein
MSRRRLIVAAVALKLAITGIFALSLLQPVLAHHGWGSYDSTTVLTLDGTVAEIDPNNPHGELKLKTADKTWIVTLSPPSRMAARGKPLTEIKVGDKVVAVGYPSRSRPDEMRAERITHNGFTVELR